MFTLYYASPPSAVCSSVFCSSVFCSVCLSVKENSHCHCNLFQMFYKVIKSDGFEIEAIDKALLFNKKKYIIYIKKDIIIYDLKVNQ